MYAVEFETDISGNTVQIPAHLLNRVATHKHVKIILLLPEEVDYTHKINLKNVGNWKKLFISPIIR